MLEEWNVGVIELFHPIFHFSNIPSFHSMRKFAISDIHGCNKTFLALLEKIQFSTADELYLLGDYIDRGPDSKGVIDSIFTLQQAGYQVHCLMGNHELMMLKAFAEEDEDDQQMNLWLRNGGAATIQSFATSDGKPDIPDVYFQFIENLKFYIETGDYILVHAGLNFKQMNPLSDEISMLWIRDWYDHIDREWLNGRIIVHGHTPIGFKNIENQLDTLLGKPVVNIDAGCVYKGRAPEFGYLCAFDLTERVLHFQEHISFL